VERYEPRLSPRCLIDLSTEGPGRLPRWPGDSDRRPRAAAAQRARRTDDVARLLGALRVSPRASRVFGADSARAHAVERAARAALGDPAAVALARSLTRAAAGSERAG
jgi:hypothetical protein